ncbi:MAG: SRPBCC family protein [Actinomycetota bacterium]|nr:SRPBCC family protein [Actinomycetota bacterium]
MSEFEASRPIAAPRDAVFAVAADPANLSRWVPGEVHVEPVADNVVRADGPLVPDAPREGVTGASEQQYRVEWGSRGDGRYAGWLQVYESGDDASEATVHLSFLGDQPQAHGGAAAADVERMLHEALDRLADVVTSGGQR